MTLSSTASLAVTELVIYSPLVPLIIYLAHRHGLPGLLGHVFLSAFATLRIIAAILNLIHKDDAEPSVSTAVVSSIGLSPLLLALSGFIHEAHRRHLTISQSATLRRHTKGTKKLWLPQIVFHICTTTGLALVASGTAGIAAPAPDEDIEHDKKLAKIGSVLLLLQWIVLAGYAAWVFKLVWGTTSHQRSKTSALALVSANVLAAPFVGARTIYAVVFAFNRSPSINPITGTLGVKLVLIVLMQLIAIAILLAGSFVTRNWYQDAKKDPHEEKGWGSGQSAEGQQML